MQPKDQSKDYIIHKYQALGQSLALLTYGI